MIGLLFYLLIIDYYINIVYYQLPDGTITDDITSVIDYDRK